MATKTYTKLKGHRVEKTTHHIPFYTTEFFEPEGSTEEDKKGDKKSQVIKIPIKIRPGGDKS